MGALKSFDASGVQFGWDSTSIQAAMTCPRKYYYSMLRKIGPRTKSVHLIFGGLYATALEHFYKHLANVMSLDEALEAVVLEALIATWDDEADQPVVFNDDKKTRFNLIRTIVWYVEEFGNEEGHGITTLHLSDGRPACELSFTFELNDEVVICGHLDRGVEYGGSKYVMDQKTTGGPVGRYFFDTFKPDVQMSIYSIAGKIVFDSPVRGVIIDAARIAVGFTEFTRGFTYRTQDELEEVMDDVTNVIHQTRTYTQLDRFPRNLTACNNYGGCPFKSLCASPPHAREAIIKAEYIEHVWDPLERR